MTGPINSYQRMIATCPIILCQPCYLHLNTKSMLLTESDNFCVKSIFPTFNWVFLMISLFLPWEGFRGVYQISSLWLGKMGRIHCCTTPVDKMEQLLNISLKHFFSMITKVAPTFFAWWHNVACLCKFGNFHIIENTRQFCMLLQIQKFSFYIKDRQLWPKNQIVGVSDPKKQILGTSDP